MSKPPRARRESPKLSPFQPSGVPNFDEISGGGLPRGALVLIVGVPGSGKTTLATQIAFAATQTGRRALILTALSEGTGKLIEHVRTYSFFRDDFVGDAVQFLSIQQFLESGLKVTATEIMRMARQMRADIVLLDGFRGMLGVEDAPNAARQFLYDIGTALGALGMTIIVTSEAESRDPALYPEMAIADMLINLHYSLQGRRHHRGFEVVKARGVAPFPGVHHMTLDADGVTLYPQLEVRAIRTGSAHPLVPAHDERAMFALPELDALLDGGLPTATSTLLAGSVGTGKTLMALYFALASIAAGEATLFMSLREHPQQLQRLAGRFALDDKWQEAQTHGLTLAYISPILLDPDRFADELMRRLAETQARRLVVDSIAEIEWALKTTGMTERREEFFAALVSVLQQRGVTTIFIKETSQAVAAELSFATDALAVVAENVLLLQQVSYRGHLRRLLSVVKMRFSGHDTSLREFRIMATTGFKVLTTDETEMDFLTEMTTQQERPLGQALPPGKTKKADET